MSSEKKRILWIVAAGTGGHIFPGLRIAESLENSDSNLDFSFFGSARRLESEIIPKHGRRLLLLRASPWKGKGIFYRVMALFDLALGFFQAFMQSFRDRPIGLLSVGGYVSLPVALAVLLRGKKVFLIEPNIRAGISNRLISRFATVAYTTPGSDAAKVFSCPVLDFGNPVRAKFQRIPIRDKVSRILVLGGSQGARSLCKAAVHLAASRKIPDSTEIFLQSGAANFEYAQELMSQLKPSRKVIIEAFIERMEETLEAADLVMARAGAMTVSELSLAALPTVFVPFPFAADDHQRVNARLLEADGAALFVDEVEENFQDRLENLVAELCADFTKRQKLAEKLSKWARPSAAEKIAADILSKL